MDKLLTFLVLCRIVEEKCQSVQDSICKCIICGKTFEKEILLYLHIISHSQEIMVFENEELELTQSNFSKEYKCESCEFSSENTKAINQHKRKHPSSMNTNKENRSPTEVAKKPRLRIGTMSHLKQSEGRKFECEKCEKTFQTSAKFECHVKIHENRPYECDVCCKSYKGKHGLKWHMKTIHRARGLRYPCKACKETFTTCSRLQQHAQECHSNNSRVEDEEKLEVASQNTCQSSGNNLQCAVCDMSFDRDEELRTHLEKHSDQETCECDVCKKSFPSKKRILLHLVKTHLNGNLIRESSVNLKSDQNKMNTEGNDAVNKKPKKRKKLEKPYKCDEQNCQYSTNQYSLLKSHKFKHNLFYECVTCQEKFPSRPELKSHMSTHGERPYKCDQCNKCYKDKHGLGWHKKVQHEPSRLKFTCELCGKTYPFDSLLTQHINLTHAPEKQSVCDICGKNVSKTYLPMHRRTHGEKQYSCDVCQKTFLEKAYLKRHRMIHTGEKPYVCNVCGNLFRQHSTLTIHMRTHTGDRPYKCVTCENAYKTHHNLKKHYRRSGHKMV